MAITGHATDAMFKRYADLFSQEESRNRWRLVDGERKGNSHKEQVLKKDLREKG